MDKGFWDKLPWPFFALAPMYDVTDAAFRQIIVECGKPHVFFTEFVSTDGLCSLGRERLMHHLRFKDNERPIVAQIFGSRPEKFYQSAKLLVELGFDGIDINMGCPDKNIIKQGSCAALFKNPKLAQEIILATKEGAGELPVSVKIRIGDTKVEWKDWIVAILKTKPAAISVHLRTRKEMSKVPAHWELMPEIVKFIHQQCGSHPYSRLPLQKVRDEAIQMTYHGLPRPDVALGLATYRPFIIGNGDIIDLEDAKRKAIVTGCDGVMLGRAIFQNPWLFNTEMPPSNPQSRLALLLRHAHLFEQNFTGIKPFGVFKRFVKIYINGFEGASDLREKLYKTNEAKDIKNIVKEFDAKKLTE